MEDYILNNSYQLLILISIVAFKPLMAKLIYDLIPVCLSSKICFISKYVKLIIHSKLVEDKLLIALIGSQICSKLLESGDNLENGFNLVYEYSQNHRFNNFDSMIF